MKLIADFGSCHLGSLKRARELISVAEDCGLEYGKFQLFPRETAGSNVYLPANLMPELIAYAQEHLDISCSVFTPRLARELATMDVTWAKIAYSQRHNYEIFKELVVPETMEQIYITYSYADLMTPAVGLGAPGKIKKLLLPHPGSYPDLVPVTFHPSMWEHFDGLSYHGLGTYGIKKAIDSGCPCIEFHMQLEDKSNCPDGFFALRPKEVLECTKF